MLVLVTWLGRFRIDGTNWEGRQWYLTPGGVSLAREVNELWPDKTPLDGTVASKGHDERNPSSDHRPFPYTASPAVVRALDVGEKVEDDGIALAEMLRATRDPRISYVLHENRIFSSYARPNREAWEWGPLSIGHEGHVHVSFTALSDTDDSPWHLVSDDMKPPDWAIPATQWHIDRNIYTQDSVDDVDESEEFHRQTVFRHRFYNAIKGEFGTGTHNHDGRYVKDIEVVR